MRPSKSLGDFLVVPKSPPTSALVHHMGSEGRLYSSKSTNGGKGLKNSKIKSY